MLLCYYREGVKQRFIVAFTGRIWFVYLSKIFFLFIVILFLVNILDRCKLRVVDTFGTEARFNYIGDIHEEAVSLGGNKELAKKLKSDPYGYGHWGLNLKQFMTMFRKFLLFFCVGVG